MYKATTDEGVECYFKKIAIENGTLYGTAPYWKYPGDGWQRNHQGRDCETALMPVKAIRELVEFNEEIPK